MNNPFKAGDRVQYISPSEFDISGSGKPASDFAGLVGTVVSNYPDDGSGSYMGRYIVKFDIAGDMIVDCEWIRYISETADESMKRKGMGHRFKLDQIVIITNDDERYYGKLGIISSVKWTDTLSSKYSVNVVKSMANNNDFFHVTLSDELAPINVLYDSDLLPYTMDGKTPCFDKELIPLPPFISDMINDRTESVDSNCQEVSPIKWQTSPPIIDVTKYLDDDTMRSMAASIFTDKFSAHVDQVIKNRAYGAGKRKQQDDMIEYLVEKVIDKMAKELSSKYEQKMIEIISYELEREEPYSDDGRYDIFKVQLGYTLNNVASNYISNHMDEITELIKAPIKKGIDTITDKNFQQTVIKKLTDSYNTILTDLLTKELHK